MAEQETKQGSGIYESPEDIAKGRAGYVRRWLEAIELAGNEEKDWRKYAEEAQKVYESADDAPTGKRFNLFYSYIETVCPSLYNSQPVPDIRRRFADKDPVAKEGADTIERILSYSIDEYDFDAQITEGVFDLSTKGRGIARVVYNAEDNGAQTVECAVVPWATFRRGPARVWAETPWVAFAVYLSRESLRELSPEHGDEVPLDTMIDKDGNFKEAANGDNPESDIFRRAMVWQIWDKDKRMVRYIAPGYAADQVAEIEDPLNLKQFFPIPRPMMTGKVSGRMVPLAPFKIMKPILEEIDNLSRRISKLVKTLRPRGLGPPGVDQDRWAAADDGEIAEVTDVAKFLQEGGGMAMEKLIAWFPLEPTIKAIEQLYIRREQAKLELFEVGGQADIMRGQSDPNETLGAQDIKQRWGSLRLQKAQAEVQRFLRDLFRLKSELIAEKFTPQNLAVMSGVDLSQPEAMQKWDATLKLIKDDKMRGYRIDIETDSTIRGDASRNMEAMSQFVQGTAQYFTALAPAVETGAVNMEAAITIYSAFARNFKLGKEVDATLDSLKEQAAAQAKQQAAQGPPPDPEMVKVQAQIEGDKAKMQLEAQKAQQDGQLKQQQAMTDAQLKEREFELKKQIALMEAELKRVIAMEDMQMKKQVASEEVGMKRQVADNDMQVKAKTADADVRIKAKTADADHKLKAEGKIGAPGQINMEQKNPEMVKAMTEIGKLIASGQSQTAELIAKSNANVVKAITAPKSVTTPDGRTYTSQTRSIN
jgi:hypothetical protein